MRQSGAVIFLSGRLVALVVLLAFQVTVVRLLGARDYGAYALTIALATLMQTVVSFGIPRLIPKYVSQAGWGLSFAVVRRLAVRIVAFRVGASAVLLFAALFVARNFGGIGIDATLVPVGVLFILASLVQVDADAMAQSLALQRVSRACTVGEASVRLLLVGLAAAVGHGRSAAEILGISVVTSATAGAVLLWTVLRALSRPERDAAAAALDRHEFRAIALSGYASAMAWFASSPAVVRLLASRMLPLAAFAGFSFAQTLVLSFQRYTPGMLVFPFVEPNVLQHYARTGDRSRLEAALSLVTKLDLVLIGATVVGTLVAGRAIVEVMTGGRYGALAYALPWLLVYIVTSSIYRAFEIVAVALGAASALVRTLALSLVWLAAAILLTPRFGAIALLACPVGDALSRLLLMHAALRRFGVRHVIDGRAALGVAALVALFGGGGRLLAGSMGAGGAATIAIGAAAGLLYLAAAAAMRLLRTAEAAIILGDSAGGGRLATSLRRYARA